MRNKRQWTTALKDLILPQIAEGIKFRQDQIAQRQIFNP